MSNRLHRNTKSCVSLLTSLVLFVSLSVVYCQEQYKKFGNKGISLIVDGKNDAAIKHYEDVLMKYPGDLESLYGLAVVYAQKRDLDRATAYVEKAVPRPGSYPRSARHNPIRPACSASSYDIAPPPCRRMKAWISPSCCSIASPISDGDLPSPTCSLDHLLLHFSMRFLPF